MLIRLLLVLLICLGAASSAEDRPKVPNPEYERWAKFKPGSWTKLVQVTDAEGSKGEITLTHTLVEMTPRKVVVETKTLAGGGAEGAADEPVRTEHPALIDDPEGPVIDPEGIRIPKPKLGEEDLAVGGKTYKCRTEHYTYRIDRDTIDNKLWLSSEVPGGVVRSVTSVKGVMPSVTTMTMVEFSARK